MANHEQGMDQDRYEELLLKYRKSADELEQGSLLLKQLIRRFQDGTFLIEYEQLNPAERAQVDEALDEFWMKLDESQDCLPATDIASS